MHSIAQLSTYSVQQQMLIVQARLYVRPKAIVLDRSILMIITIMVILQASRVDSVRSLGTSAGWALRAELTVPS